MQYIKNTSFIHLLLAILIILNSCGLYRYTDQRNQPSSGLERARKNVEEGKGIGIKNILGNKNTNYEFSSSNPMWRAALELLDFMPLSTVDYSGGVVITDWYSNKSEPDQIIKVTIRFLGTEISPNNLKVIVHKKDCSNAKLNEQCPIVEFKSKINEELVKSIVREASVLTKIK